MASDEYKIHVAILKHIRSAFPQVKAFHIPNQTRNATEAFFNKQMGVEAGASDFIIGWKPSKTGVLEVKTEDGRVSTPQNKFMSWAHSIGWNTGVARSVHQAHTVLKEWGLQPEHEAIREPDFTTEKEKLIQARDLFKP